MTTLDSLTLRRPDDWHVHVRDGEMLRAVLPSTASVFGRAMIMPNLAPPVVTAEDARAYRARIDAAVPEGARFQPLLALYLTDATDPDDVALAFRTGAAAAVKLYPANATTNSAHGVTSMTRVRPVLERMAELGMPLLVHGEVTDADVDVFDREAVFLERVLAPLVDAIPTLRVVVEHVTTRDAVDFVKGARPGIAATITAHHLVTNRTDMFRGGLRPHLYCLPVPKREAHRRALVDVATSGDPRFFLGTDSAPHARSKKEAACGCAGVFSAPVALAVYARVFDDEGALDRLEGFASLHGAAFYGLPPNEERVRLTRREVAGPSVVACGDDPVVVFEGGAPQRFAVEVLSPSTTS